MKYVSRYFTYREINPLFDKVGMYLFRDFIGVDPIMQIDLNIIIYLGDIC